MVTLLLLVRSPPGVHGSIRKQNWKNDRCDAASCRRDAITELTSDPTERVVKTKYLTALLLWPPCCLNASQGRGHMSVHWGNVSKYDMQL